MYANYIHILHYLPALSDFIVFICILSFFVFCACRNMKLLRKIEKLHRKEKKLETKLDQRIEKMETRKKRMLERASCPRNGKHKLSEESGSEGYGPASLPKWLSGVPLTKLLPIHVLPQQVFSRTWEVLNNGIVPWTDNVSFFINLYMDCVQ